MKVRTKVWWVAVATLVAVVGFLVGVKALQIVKMINVGKSFVPPPESVTTAPVRAERWHASRAAIGTLVAVHGVTLGAEVTGQIRQVGFDSGTFVKQGAVLVKLDTSVEEAQLTAAEADASLAQISLDRAKTLRQGEANAPADLDAAEARAKQANASVANLQATIAKKTIRAPFDGRIAIRQVEVGQIVSPGTPIASLQSVSPIYVEFSLPQQAIADVRPGQRVRVRTDVFPGDAWDGTVSTVNSEVDVATRNVRVRATVPNPDGRLRPGMFANVEIIGTEERPALVVPATAVLFAPYGDSVFVLEEKAGPDGRPSTVVRQRFVRLGERRGDLVAIDSGLSAGETVVSSGAFKLRNGTAVVAKNDLAPNAQAAPKPTEN
ncbi:MAG TPA: efflux RND transporter periplasmic adaptor subunit [Anaeromyxobacteraceae bacterium]|nr:efflux RND transporter periplasmic adaptor subunit [Anaeromyxobacteraceae bacterium]